MAVRCLYGIRRLNLELLMEKMCSFNFYARIQAKEFVKDLIAHHASVHMAGDLFSETLKQNQVLV